jgi:hypothetical protein
MTKPNQTWWEKRLAKEEGGSSGEEVSKVISVRGEHNLESGDGNPELGNYHSKSSNCNPNSGNSEPGKENDRQGKEPDPMDVNMVFTIPTKLCAPTEDITELALGAKRAVFENQKIWVRT